MTTREPEVDPTPEPTSLKDVIAQPLTEPPATPAIPPLPALTSLPASGPSAPLPEAVGEALQLVQSNLELLFKRNEQHGKLLESAWQTMGALSDRMRQTLTLAEQVIGGMDEHTERIGVATLALTKMHEELQSALARLRERG